MADLSSLECLLSDVENNNVSGRDNHLDFCGLLRPRTSIMGFNALNAKEAWTCDFFFLVVVVVVVILH